MSVRAGLNNSAESLTDADNSLTSVALAQIREMMSQMLQNIQSQQSSGSLRLWGKQGPPELSSEGNTAHIHWKPHNIGIFWLNIPSSYGTGDIVNDRKKQYYCNVHSFIAWIKIVILSWDILTIWQNLNNCLKREAQDWWTNQLTHIIRVSIMYDINDLDEWIKALKKRFWEASSVALNKLHKMKYIIQNTYNERESSEYITAIGITVKGCEQSDTEFAQVLHVFCRINSDLWHFSIDKSEENIIIQNFINLLNQKKMNWFDHYTKKEQQENSHSEKQQDWFQSQWESWNYSNQRDLYSNSHCNWQLMAQFSSLYDFNNQQCGYDQGFNQGMSYNQGYNWRGGAFSSHFSNKNNSAYVQQQRQDAPVTVSVNQQTSLPSLFQNLCLYNGETAPSSRANASNCYRSGYYKQHFQPLYSPCPLLESCQIVYNDEPHEGALYNDSHSNQGQGYFRDPAWDEYSLFPPNHDTQEYYTYFLKFSYNEHMFQSDLELLNDYSPSPGAFYSNQGSINPYRDNNPNDHDKVNAQFVSELMIKLSCHPCQAHKGHSSSVKSTLPEECIIVKGSDTLNPNCLPEKVIELSITHTHQPDYRFREWHYATAEVCFEQDSEAHSICFDTDCSVTLIDWEFLNKVALNTEVHHSEPVNINEITGSETTHEYTLLEL